MCARSHGTTSREAGRGMGPDVLLVSMPFGSLRDPSLALSLLKAALPGRRVDIHYFTLPFADRIGAKVYEDVSRGLPAPALLAGEALFRNALFPNRHRSLARYLQGATRQIDGGATRLAAAVAAAERQVVPFLDRCAELVFRASPRIVGFTSLFQQQVASLALARRLKRDRPGLFVVIGGGNCLGPAARELVRQFRFLDAVVCGEGEALFPEIVERVLTGRNVDDLQGVHTPRNSHRATTRATDGAPVAAALDALPVPDYADFFRQWESSRVGQRLEPRLPFETSRGCWWGEKHQCTFCGLNGPALDFRRKSTGRALREFRTLLARFPVRTVTVSDSVLDARWFGSLLPALSRRRVPVDLVCEVRPNLNKAQVRLLRASGVREIQPGIESLSDEVLSLMSKGVTALQNIQLLKWCAELHLWPTWHFLWGFPREPREEYRRMAQMLPLLAHLPPPTAWGRIRLDRFSPNFERAQALGISNVAPWRSYAFLYPDAPNQAANLACSFSFSYEDGRRVDDYTAPLSTAIRTWRRVHRRSALVHVNRNGRLWIVDSRPTAKRLLTVLDGRLKALYLACDGVRTLDSLAREAQRDGARPRPDDVARMLAPLVEGGLMLRDGDRMLSLAVRGKR